MNSIFSLPLFVSFLLLSVPHTACASEGLAWIYFVMAPFSLFTTPFFMTAVCVAMAAYCYWRYRTTTRKYHAMITLLILLVAIPVAVRDKLSYVAAKHDREDREQAQLLAKQRREARRAGKHFSPEFTAISTAYTAKYLASAKTEADRLNFQASRDLLQMKKALGTMQNNEPPPKLHENEEKPPVRTVKTALFELYAAALLIFALLTGALAERWRRNRGWSPPRHLFSLLVCIYVPVLAQLPFMEILMGQQGPLVYFSWFALRAFSPISYFVAYLAGVALWSRHSARTEASQSVEAPSDQPEREILRPTLPPEQPTGESSAPRGKSAFTFNGKKVLAGMAVLLLLDWVVQTMLLNTLIVLGSNAGAKFTPLPPQALLPWTMPTRVRLMNKATDVPLSGKNVRVTWEYNTMGMLPQPEARYADHTYTTDSRGEIRLPCRLKPVKAYLLAFCQSINQGIFLHLNDPGYIPAGDRPYLSPRIQGERLAETIPFTPCRSAHDWECALGRASLFPYAYLKEAINGVVRQIPLETMDDEQIRQLSKSCDPLVTAASQKIDEEVVKRGAPRICPETYIRTLIRSGREKDAVAALPRLEGRPYAEEWRIYFQKFVNDLAFEKDMAREANPLISLGKSGAQLHEEALALHRQGKYRECFPLYQAAVTLSPTSGRYAGNYACAVMSEHQFYSEKLSRRAISLDRNRGHSYLMLADLLLASDRTLGAYLLAKEALRLGWRDTFTWSKIALAADKMYEQKEAEAAAREALKLDPNNPDLKLFKLGHAK